MPELPALNVERPTLNAKAFPTSAFDVQRSKFDVRLR